MRLALIGMSGTGKSHWSHRLAQIGFQRIGCDDRIAAWLAREVGAPPDHYFNMGQWMGFPHDPHYRARADRYLAIEIEIMHQITADLAAGQPAGDVVIDTTGSVIYVPEEALWDLQAQAQVVYLAPPLDAFQTMLQAYLQNPRPLLWNGVYQPLSGESPVQTFERCYPQLLISRDALYRRYSHVTIPYAIHGKPEVSVETLLEMVQR